MGETPIARFIENMARESAAAADRLVADRDTLRAQLTEKDREIEALNGTIAKYADDDVRYLGTLAEKDREIEQMGSLLSRAHDELLALATTSQTEAAELRAQLSASQAREREAVERAEKAEAEAAAWSGHYGEVGTENPEVMLAELQRLTPEDLAPIKGLFERKKRERERIAGLESALAAARKALNTAMVAMEERRAYVNAGDPATCWQEMKYGKTWDAEDAEVSAALERINGEGHE